MAAWGQQDNSTAGLQKQYNDLSSQLAGGVNGSFDSPAYYALRAQRDQLGARMGQSSAATAAPAVDPAKSRQQILDNTQGRGDYVMNDAMTNAALGRLQGVATGEDAPFTQSVQNQMLAKQAGMNASGQASQAESLRMQAAGNGGSIVDPSYQAKLRELAANSQASNLSAQGEIGTTAQLQNFGARQTANNSLLSGRMGQMGMANSQYNQAAQFLQNDSTMGPHQGAVSTPAMPMYNFASGAGSKYGTPPISYQQYTTGLANGPGAAAAQPSATGSAGGAASGAPGYAALSTGQYTNANQLPYMNPAGGIGGVQYGPPSPNYQPQYSPFDPSSLYNFDPNLPVY